MGKIFAPKPPAPPVMVMPEPEEAPEYIDDDRDEAAAEEARIAARKRKGRRSTILTGSGITIGGGAGIFGLNIDPILKYLVVCISDLLSFVLVKFIFCYSSC